MLVMDVIVGMIMIVGVGVIMIGVIVMRMGMTVMVMDALMACMIVIGMIMPAMAVGRRG